MVSRGGEEGKTADRVEKGHVKSAQGVSPCSLIILDLLVR